MNALPHDLTTSTCLVALFEDGAASRPTPAEPVWMGSLHDWWADNPELGWTWGDIHAALVELANGGNVPLGGGAGQGFTLCRAYGDTWEHSSAALVALAALRDRAEKARRLLERDTNPLLVADHVRSAELWAEDARKHLAQIDPRTGAGNGEAA